MSDKSESDFERPFSVKVITGWWADFRVSASFLTRLPLDDSAAREKGALAGAVRAFPLVGLMVGVAGALAFAIADGLNLPPVISAIIALGTMIGATGALHEDGIADCADAFLTQGDKTAKLKVMRDSRIGTYGTVALVLTLAMRVGVLTVLATADQVAAALFATAAASRAAMPVMMHYMKPARRSGLAVTAGKPDRDQVIITILLGGALALLFLGPVVGVLALLVGAGGVASVVWFSRRQIGGVTGDVLGAGQQAMEIGMLLAIVALA